MIRTKNQKELDRYILEKRTEWNARPVSQEQIESCGRNAMRTITKLLEQNQGLREEIKEYAKQHPYQRRKKEPIILPFAQKQEAPGSHAVQ